LSGVIILWTLQHLCFGPDVAADYSDRGENRRAAIDDQKYRVHGSNHQTFEKLDEDIGAQGRYGWPQRNSELRGLQREGEIIDAFLAAQHKKNPLFLRKRHAQIRRLNV
jgi:hypothetical protein